MKLKGKELRLVNEDTIVIPKNGENIVFKLRAVSNYSEFDRLYPEPQPPMRTGKGEVKIPKLNDPAYLAQVSKRNRSQTFWLTAKTLSATEGLEFEYFDFDKHETWTDLERDFYESGFTESEISYILQKVFEVNALSTEKIEAARETFLAEQQKAQLNESSQTDEQTTMESGEPAKD